MRPSPAPLRLLDPKGSIPHTGPGDRVVFRQVVEILSRLFLSF